MSGRFWPRGHEQPAHPVPSRVDPLPDGWRWRGLITQFLGQVYESRDGLRVIVSLDPVGDRGPHRYRWHMSASREDRLPGWDELRDARYLFVPGEITMAMLLPPRSQYVNINRWTFHLWETRDTPEDRQ